MTPPGEAPDRYRRAATLLGVVLLLAVVLLVRGPLHRATYALPVSNDDAILLLMARHILQGELATILWNQPYNGALDAYLLAPFVAVAGHHAGFRAYEIVCAVLLAVLACLLARGAADAPRADDQVAAWTGALLAAWGTPYMALMTATGPPPNFLMPLVTGFPLALVLGSRGVLARRAGGVVALALGLVCGLAIWNSSLAIPAFAGMAVGLWLAGARPGRGALVFVAGLAIGAFPLLLARLIGASGAATVTAASAVTAVRPLWLVPSGFADLSHAITGLFGLQVPLVVDGPERAALPLAARIALPLGLTALVVAGAWGRRSLPLVLWAGALAGAFVLSRRTGPDELRYLYGVNPPVLALAALGFARLWRWQRPAALAAIVAVLAPWAYADRLLAATWRDPAHAVRVWQVPPIGPALSTLERARVASVYASLQFAGRITLESKESVVASQAWNERIPGDPLRFRDEVDLDPQPAWVLSPHLSRGMPRAGGFRDLLREMGGAWREDAPGDLVVFRGFRPPYDESRPVPASALRVATTAGAPLPAAVTDRDVATAWTAPEGLGRGQGLVVAIEPPRRLSALVVAVDLERSPLAVPWVAESRTAGGEAGEIVARGPLRHGLQWVNGAPRAGRQGLMAVVLGDRPTREVRLIFQDAGPPLVVAEVFAYGPDEPSRPDAGMEAARRGLAAVRAPGGAGYRAGGAGAGGGAPPRRWLDVESLGDGGPDLVVPR
jgi:hypothetical protein